MTPTLSNRIQFILALAGCVVAAALTLEGYRYVSLPCGPTDDCATVAAHPTAHGFGISALSGIPTAAFGLLFYLGMSAIAFGRAAASEQKSRGLRRFQWLGAIAGVAVSAYLTYLEKYVIHAWCKWCLASAGIAVLMFITSSAEHFSGSGKGMKSPIAQGETV